MCRFVVEVVNAMLKNVFKRLGSKIESRTKPYLKDDLQICGAILNDDHRRILTDKPHHAELARRSVERAEMANLLQGRLEDGDYPLAKSNWIPLTAQDIAQFPRLSDNDFLEITGGVYQFEQASLYIKRQLEDSEYDVGCHRLSDAGSPLLMCRVESRFTRIVHKVYVQYAPEKQGVHAILGYFCSCKNGARIVGCCSHVTAVLKYLGYDTYQPPPTDTRNVPPPTFIDATAELKKHGLAWKRGTA